VPTNAAPGTNLNFGLQLSGPYRDRPEVRNYLFDQAEEVTGNF
jgi:hypothetical protein